jgi:hypothetical protein
MRSPLPLLIALIVCLTACSSLDEHLSAARALDDSALATPSWPEDSIWVVIANGETAGALTEEKAHEIQPRAAHRYVFRPGDTGDTRPRMAYLPTAALIAGRQFAESLGLTLRRDADGRAILTRDARRLTSEAGGTVIVRVSAPDGSVESAAAVLLDPDFYGPLLLSPSIAEQLGLRRFEVPGVAHVDVALGRPFVARRARLIVRIEELDVAGPVRAIFPY